MNFKKGFINATLALSLTLSASPLVADAAAFKDTNGHWADAAIQWAKDNKITSGYPDGTFKPNAQVSEEEFVSMLLNSFTTPNLNTKIYRWSDRIYEVARHFNYPVSLSDVVKELPLKRDEVAEIVAGTQGKNYSGDYAIQFVMGSGLASGKVPGEFTIASFKGNDTLTRGEAVAFIQKLKQNPIASKELLLRPKETSPISELPKVDKGVIPPSKGLPTTAAELKDPTGRIHLDNARKFEMAVHDSYKFGPDSLTVTVPDTPRGYAMDVQYYVEYKDGTYEDLGQQVWTKDPSNAFVGGGSYTMKINWDEVKDAYFRAGLMDVSDGGVRRYSYYQYSTKQIVEKVKF